MRQAHYTALNGRNDTVWGLRLCCRQRAAAVCCRTPWRLACSETRLPWTVSTSTTRRYKLHINSIQRKTITRTASVCAFGYSWWRISILSFSMYKNVEPIMVILCGWEGNRRSGGAVAMPPMRHRLSGIPTYGALWPNANDTRSRNRYRNPVPGNWYHFSDRVFFVPDETGSKISWLIFYTTVLPIHFKAIKQQITQLHGDRRPISTRHFGHGFLHRVEHCSTPYQIDFKPPLLQQC